MAARTQQHLSLAPPMREVAPLRPFCGHCGHEPAARIETPRVCARCEMGLVLEAAADVAPDPGDAFLVIDASLLVGAASRRAEEVLGLEEQQAVGRPIADLLVPGVPGESLEKPVARAATGSPGPHEVNVLDARMPSARYRARIGACGPPTAALVVLLPPS